MSRRLAEQKARWLLRKACRGVDVEDVTEVCEELPLEVARPAVVGAELGL